MAAVGKTNSQGHLFKSIALTLGLVLKGHAQSLKLESPGNFVVWSWGHCTLYNHPDSLYEDIARDVQDLSYQNMCGKNASHNSTATMNVTADAPITFGLKLLPTLTMQ